MFALVLFWSWTSGVAPPSLASACIDLGTGSAAISFSSAGSVTIDLSVPCDV